MSREKPSLRNYALPALGVALIVAGIVVGWTRASGGPDFAVLRAMAVGIWNGVNVDELNAPNAVGHGVVGMVYPPAIGFVVLPLAWMPPEAGRIFWFLVMNFTLVFGIRALVRSYARPEHFPFWGVVAGLVLFSASVRWGMMLIQGAPFVLGLLCFFLTALKRGQQGLALALTMIAIAFKMTLAIPFVGLLLLERRIFATGIAGATWLGLNALGYVRMGSDAFATYRSNVATFEAINDFNINGPDPWMGITLPRLDWVYLFYGISRNLELSRLANAACALLVALLLLRAGLRARNSSEPETRTLFLAAFVCLGSLCVYHHQYDLCLYIAPVLLAGFAAPALVKPSAPFFLSLPLVLTIAILPIGLVQRLIESVFGTHWVALLKMSFPVVITLGLFGALLGLHQKARNAVTSKAEAARV